MAQQSCGNCKFWDAYEDDSQIWKLSVEWALDIENQLATCPGGWVMVTIKEM